MKYKYIAVLSMLAVLLSVFAFAETDNLKYKFFNSSTVLDVDDFSLSNGIYSSGNYVGIKTTIGDTSGNIEYNVYTNDNKNFYIESPLNFEGTILLKDNCDEIIFSKDKLQYFFNTISYTNKYKQFTQLISKALIDNTNEGDFTKTSSYASIDGTKRKYDTVILEKEDAKDVLNSLKDTLSDDFLVSLLSDCMNVECSNDDLKKYTDELFSDIFSDGKYKFIWKRNILNKVAFFEDISIIGKTNVFEIVIENNVSSKIRSGKISFLSTTKELDFNFKFELQKNADVKTIDLIFENTNGTYKISAKKDKDLTLDIRSKDCDYSCKFINFKDYTTVKPLYDISIPSQKRLLLTNLSGWFSQKPNDAKWLFKTYEIELEKNNYDNIDIENMSESDWEKIKI